MVARDIVVRRLFSPACFTVLVGVGLLVGLAGCSGDLPKSDVIDKLRLLAIRATPPEIQPGQTATFDARIARPSARLDLSSPTLSYLWLACTEPTGSAMPTACGVTLSGNGGPDTFDATDGGTGIPSCQDAPNAALCLLGTTPTVALTPTPGLGAAGLTQIVITLIVSDQDALTCARFAAQGTGAPDDPDHCIIAIKRLTVSSSTSPNHNPRLSDFALGNISFGSGAPVFCPPSAGSETLAATLCENQVPLPLDCAIGDGAEVVGTDGSGNATYEQLYVSWFTTAGVLADARTSFQGIDTGTSWTAPDSAERLTRAPDGFVEFWAVVRDDRGGVGWLQGLAEAAPSSSCSP